MKWSVERFLEKLLSKITLHLKKNAGVHSNLIQFSHKMKFDHGTLTSTLRVKKNQTLVTNQVQTYLVVLCRLWKINFTLKRFKTRHFYPRITQVSLKIYCHCSRSRRDRKFVN